MIVLALAALLGTAPVPTGPTVVQPRAPAALPAGVVPAPGGKPDPVTEPNWVNAPNQALLTNCATGYLTDPTFTGESIVMGCVVQADGTLDACQVKETKRAQAAGAQDVAVCAAAGFRIGPLDKFGKPTAGRPIIIPMAIATMAEVGKAAKGVTPVEAGTAGATPAPTTTPTSAPAPVKPPN